jgi:hypothetical protein
MLKQQTRFFKIIGITAERALSQYNIPTIESYIDQQCVAVTERILKDPHHPITVAQEKKKSLHNTRGSQFATKRTNTNKYQNSCLQSALQMMRDGYKNKYTNPRRTDTTTDEYQVEIHSIKKSSCKNPKRLQEKTTTTIEVTSDTVDCEHCGLTFKANGIKRHQTVKHKNAQVNH